MTTLTIRFSGLQEQILERLVKAGVAESKSEAIRMALLNTAYQLNLLEDKTIVEFLRKQLSKGAPSPEELYALIERAKHETIAR